MVQFAYMQIHLHNFANDNSLHAQAPDWIDIQLRTYEFKAQQN